VEFAIVFMVFMILVLGIIEFSLVIFNASRLNEATRTGARFAIVNNPACNIFARAGAPQESGCPSNSTLDCTVNPIVSVTLNSSSCTFPAPVSSPGCRMVEVMDQIMLRDSTTNSVLSGNGKVSITYTCSQTGDPEIPRVVPVVTVSAEDIEHPMMFSSIFGFYSPDGEQIGPTITLPNFTTSRTGEDMYTE
jgi:hypothetical protein